MADETVISGTRAQTDGERELDADSARAITNTGLVRAIVNPLAYRTT
jgi:hypothetical protein